MRGIDTKRNHYGLLLIMVGLHFIAMYVLMYSMVNIFDNTLNNINQVYMAGMMTTPMVVLELFLMRTMFSKKLLNIALAAISILIGASLFTFVRFQVGIGDTQFLRSMIPHHAAAILMCQQADITDPEIKELCQGIIASQQSEIDFMQAKLDRLN